MDTENICPSILLCILGWGFQATKIKPSRFKTWQNTASLPEGATFCSSSTIALTSDQ